MGLSWSDWSTVDPAITDPYHHWAMSPSSESAFADFVPTTSAPAGDEAGVDLLEPVKGQFMLPPHTLRDASDPALPAPPWVQSKALPELQDDTVIIGVIDTDIPLGHNRTRLPDGRTRIVSAWQMMAPYSDAEGDRHMPFGRELLASDIDAALSAASGGSLLARLDEDAFNQATFGLDMLRSGSSRSLAGVASHGAHVLDVAAGADQHSAGEAHFRDRTRIIAVNAPNAGVFGPSGTYMNAYLLSGVQHIVDTADRLWQHRSNEAGTTLLNAEGTRGFPIVINMSFGTQAGSKDLRDDFAAQLSALHAYRAENNLSEVRIVMPTGNDNLDRCNAFMNLTSDAEQTLDWRILPEDHSSNFAELWVRGRHRRTALKLDLLTPFGAVPDLKHPDLSDAALQMCELSDDSGVIARIYHQRKTLERKKGKEKHGKDRFVLCVAPTYRQPGERKPIAPAGRWQIALARRGSKTRLVSLSVQTDQRLSGSQALNLRSYFDDPKYQVYGAMGEVMESYSYPTAAGQKPENQDKRSGAMVRRHGTQNASAAHEAVASVGGYRASDGRPAKYSSTGTGRKSGKDIGIKIKRKQRSDHRLAPSGAFVTDDAPSLFGILAAGARDGTVVAMRGTSFASSQGTRLVAAALLDGETGSAHKIIHRAAKRAEKSKPEGTIGYPRKEALIEVLGRGRIDAPYRDWKVTR